MSKGFFTFMLHSHMPYLRAAGMWPFGEETLHEVMAETYLPLLDALYDLKEQGLEPKLTLGLTPILAEQIADGAVLRRFEAYLQDKAEIAGSEAGRYQRERAPQRVELAGFYNSWYAGLLEGLHHRCRGDLLGSFRRLQEEGNLQVITSAATHGYLPLLERDSSIHAQLHTGAGSYARLLGRRPRGVWLPECGYRPAYYRGVGEEAVCKPGLEEHLQALDLTHFFTDSHVIEGGAMLGKVVGDAVGPYGAIPRRRLVHAQVKSPPTHRTTLRPYYVQDTDVAVFGREQRTGLQVWSAAHGYPGDFLYREFHRKDERSGLQYWRITDASGDLGAKDLYDPARAREQVSLHASHFCSLVEERLERYHAETGQAGLVVSAYDSELFGHWWFEGVQWLKEVLALLARSEVVSLTTTGEYLSTFPPNEALGLAESSWGNGGGHYTWLNEDTTWMWPLIHEAELRMERAVERWPQAQGVTLKLLNQAARELLLLQASDWPFLVTTGQAADYAAGRFRHHLARFDRLLDLASGGDLSPEDNDLLGTVCQLDNPFPDLDYRVFAEREGHTGP